MKEFNGEVRELKRRAADLGLVALTTEEVQDLSSESYLFGLWTGALAVASLACCAVTLLTWFG